MRHLLKTSHGRGTRGTEASQYPQEKKAIAMPRVTASESGPVQTESVGVIQWRCGVWTSSKAFILTRSFLERNTIQGDSPVEEGVEVCGSIPSTTP